MIDNDYIMNEIRSIFAILDADELPEVYEYLAQIIAEDELSDTPFDIATGLRRCDRKQDFPECLLDLIVELYEAEIAEGEAGALNDLGTMYYGGEHGFEQNYHKAIAYYEAAAEKGSLLAHENLGYCWYYGRNRKKDYEKAFRYFAYGALCGSISSTYKIGDMYQNGYYLPRNETKAYYMYLRCLSMIDEDTPADTAGPLYLRLGKVFLYGIGAEQDCKFALECYQKAEAYLYDVLKSGDDTYRNSWQEAIEGQMKARESLVAEL